MKNYTKKKLLTIQKLNLLELIVLGRGRTFKPYLYNI